MSPAIRQGSKLVRYPLVSLACVDCGKPYNSAAGGMLLELADKRRRAWMCLACVRDRKGDATA